MKVMCRLLFSLLCLILATANAGAQTTEGWSETFQARLDSITAEGDSLLAEVARGEATRFDYLFLEFVMEREKGNEGKAFELLKQCLEMDSTSAAVRYYLAQYYLGQKDSEMAMAEMKRATELSPDNTIYLEMFARMLIGVKDYPAATKVVEKLVAKETDRADMVLLLYQLYEQEKDYENAIKTIDRLEVLQGKSEQLSYRKSDIYRALGKKDEAIAEMKALADEHPNDPTYRCIYADVLMSTGDIDGALKIFNDVLREDSTNVRALLSMYAYYADDMQNDKAVAMAMRMLLSKDTPDDLKVRIIQAEISETEKIGGDMKRMTRYFKTMLAQPEPSVEMALMYAAYLDLKKMPRDSVKAVLHQALDIAPDNVPARMQLVGYAWEKNDMQSVISLCADARRYNPDQMLFYYYQGMAYYRIGQRDNALGAFKNGIDAISTDSDPEMVSDFYAVMGDLLYAKGQHDEAFVAYDSCLQWKPDNIGCLNNYAYFLSTANRQLDKAEQMSYKAIKAEPKNATYLDTYAWILFLQERYGEAKVYIDEALKNDSVRNPEVVEHAGDIYAMNGDINRAVELWKEAFVKDRNNQVLSKKIRKRKYIKP